MTFDEKVTPVWKIPFPAVTIFPHIFTQMESLNTTFLINYLEANNPPFDKLTEDM